MSTSSSPLGEYAELVERLRHADLHSQQRILGSRIFGEAADAIEAMGRALAEARAEARDADGDLYRDLWKASSRNVGRVCGVANRQRDALEAATRALAPLANFARHFDGAHTPDDRVVLSCGASKLTVGDLRRARSVLAREEEDGR